MSGKGSGKLCEVVRFHTGIMEILHYMSMGILHQSETNYFHLAQLVQNAKAV